MSPPPISRTLLLCPLLCAITVAARGGTLPDATATRSRAVIRLDYPGARLRIDDREPALADTGTAIVPAGEHRLALYPPLREGRWIPPLLGRRIRLAPGETRVIDPAAVVTVYVETIPDGAEIRLAGSTVGTSPCLVPLLRGEARELLLTKNGYRRVEVAVTADEALRIRLDPTRGTDSAIASAPPRGWLPWVSFSAFAASTAGGFYSRRRADDLYERYLRTASADRRDELFDHAATWDNRARALWIGGQVALGATIWLLLRHMRHEEDFRGRRLDLSIDPRAPGGPSVRVAWAWGGVSR